MYPWDYLWRGMDRQSSPAGPLGWCCRTQVEMCNRQLDLWKTKILQLFYLKELPLVFQTVPMDQYYIWKQISTGKY